MTEDEQLEWEELDPALQEWIRTTVAQLNDLGWAGEKLSCEIVEGDGSEGAQVIFTW